DDGRRCWRVLKGAVVHNAVHRVCISVDTRVEWGVENLWINPGRSNITADKGRTTPRIWCGQESLRRVGPGYCVGRVGFRPYFRRVTRWLRGSLRNATEIVRQPHRRGHLQSEDTAGAKHLGSGGGRCGPPPEHEQTSRA